jgi:hypothetical protein
MAQQWLKSTRKERRFSSSTVPHENDGLMPIRGLEPVGAVSDDR